MNIRERPPLRLYDEIITPSGVRYRWGPDEPDARNVPTRRRDSSTLPGGFETGDATLPRKPGLDYQDIERLSTHRRCGAGGEVAYEGRLERAPKVAGDQFAISPSSVGWQAHLDDDKSAAIVYIDRDLSRWENPSSQRQINLIGGGFSISGPEVRPDITTGTPALVCSIIGNWDASAKPAVEANYNAGNTVLGRLRATWTKGSNIVDTNPDWSWDALLSDTDTQNTVDTTGNLRSAGPGTIDLTSTDDDRRFSMLRLSFASGPAGGANLQYELYWTDVRVFGNHNLTIRGSTAATQGFYDADIVGYALTRWCPLLTYTSESLQADPTFVIPQAAFLDPTTAGEIVRQATRFSVRPWAVWEDKTFWLYDWGTKGRNWRARVGPTHLEETGPQVDRLWNSIVVAYQDVDGTTRTVGPVGSGADTEDSALTDDDPNNPANKLGIDRRDLLTMGTATAAAAIEVGRRFLEESKRLDSSGQATFTGYIEDDRAIVHPYWKVRAGDTVTFLDASDTSARRIVRADHDHDARSCTVDLDSPPEGLQALLERLQVVLTPLGL